MTKSISKLISALVAALVLSSALASAQNTQRLAGLQQFAGTTTTVTPPPAILTPEAMRTAAAQHTAAVGSLNSLPIHFPAGYQQLKDAANERKRLGATQGPSLAPLAPTSLAAPALGPVFTGIVAGGSNCGCLPPDTIAAVGGGYVVEGVNVDIAIWDTSGNKLLDESLTSFFSPVLAPLGLTAYSDPQVVFDQNSNRWFVTIIDSSSNHVALAVSLDSNPLDGFSEFRLDASDGNTTGLADQPKLGVSKSAVYISTNQFGNSQAELQVVNLPSLLSGILSVTVFQNFTTAGGATPFSIIPAVTYGATQNEYLIGTNPYSSSSTLNLFSINTSGTPVLTALDLNIAPYNVPPSADQPGAPQSLATDDARIENAVWQNGVLVAAQNVGDPTGTAAVAQFYVINLPDATGLSGASLADSGMVSGVGEAYYPAITRRSDGQIVMVFSTSSLTDYVSAAFAAKRGNDLPGVMAGPFIFFAGNALNNESFRWGDYSGISIDPSDNSFWMAAEPAGNLDPLWQTVIGNFRGLGNSSSSTSLISSLNPSLTTEPVTFTATVTSVSGTPTGTVTFLNGTTPLGSGTLSAGQATLTTTFATAGSYGITAIYNGDADFVSSASAVLQQAVQLTQTIKFGVLPTREIGAPPFTVTATASSGLPVSFASTTTTICTVSGNTVTLLKTGQCSITASQAGNITYAPAPPVVQAFFIGTKKTQSITFAALPNQPLGAPPFTVTATASSGLPVSFASITPSTCTVSGSTVTLVAAGTCSIKATQAGNATYAAALPVTRSFQIQKLAQTITFGALPSHTVTDPPFTISATASSGLAVSFTSINTGICTVSGHTVTLVAFGSCSIKATQAGNATYAAALPVTQTFSVKPLTQTITFAPIPNMPIDSPAFTIKATASSGLQVDFFSTTPTCTAFDNFNGTATVTLNTIGTCSIEAYQFGDLTYASTFLIRSFQVQQPQLITFAALPNQPINTPPFTITATASSGLPVSFMSNTPTYCTVSGNTVTLVAAGKCYIRATQAGNTTYAPAPAVTQIFQITKLAQTISFAPLPSQLLGSPPFTVAATASSGLAVSFSSLTSSTCTVAGNTVTLVATGTCTIKATQAGNATYTVAAVTQSFQIKP